MAVITSFERGDAKNLARHKTNVVARFVTFGDGPNGPMTQISTGGSADRAFPGKVSQTLQLDRHTAQALWTLLGETYGFK